MAAETRAQRDARRYAEWEERGKPPSPCEPLFYWVTPLGLAFLKRARA